MLYKTNYKSIFCTLTICSDGMSVVGLWTENQKYFAAGIKESMTQKADLDIFNKTKFWLDQYFSRKQPKILDIPLSPQGSEFQQAVWKLLCEIPYGETTTYGQIAQKLAKQLQKTKISPRAVGNAISRNPISIIIPCHRVIGANGSLTGYAGGINLKKKLLELENPSLMQNKNIKSLNLQNH